MTYRTIHLSAAGTALVIGVPDTGLPHVLHWGADLTDTEGLATAVRAAAPPARGVRASPRARKPGAAAVAGARRPALIGWGVVRSRPSPGPGIVGG